MRGDNHLNICTVRIATGRDSLHRLLSEWLSLLLVCRLSFGSDIHSRMIFGEPEDYTPDYQGAGRQPEYFSPRPNLTQGSEPVEATR